MSDAADILCHGYASKHTCRLCGEEIKSGCGTALLWIVAVALVLFALCGAIATLAERVAVLEKNTTAGARTR